jgi:DNA-binding transcriptional regulator LsrR (DeoR family)
MQIMAVNGIKEFLRVERLLDEAEVERMLAQAKEKERILRRIMDSNLRMCGIGFRQAHQHTVEARDKERV